MAHTQFEPVNPGFFEGTASVEVLDPSGMDPARIIQTDHAWQIDVTWLLEGSLANGMIPLMAADWTVAVYAESLGAGATEEKQIGAMATVSFGSGTALDTLRREYKESISVPAFTADPVAGLPAGAYRLVTIILAEQGAGAPSPGTPLEYAAFVEGPVVQLYEA